MQIQRLFEEMGYPYSSMVFDDPIDVSHLGYEIKSYDTETGQVVWSRINKIVRKDDTQSYILSIKNAKAATGSALTVSPLHQFYVKVKGSDPHWVEAVALSTIDQFEVMTCDGWQDAFLTKCLDATPILDIEVDKFHCYFSNGVLSHNTVYGDPTYTPGGQGIPFHASVRIRLLGGSQIKDKAGGVMGITVRAKTVKNKVARPFREVEFDIHFGRGLVENEQLFDVLRNHCKEHGPIVFDDKEHLIEGDGGWKTFQVSSAIDGTVLIEKKFNKSNFGELLLDRSYGPIIESMLEKAMVITSAATDELHKEDGEMG